MVRNSEKHTLLLANVHIYIYMLCYCVSDSLYVEYLGSYSVPAIVLDHISSRNPWVDIFWWLGKRQSKINRLRNALKQLPLMNHRPDWLFTLVKIMLLKKFPVKMLYRRISQNCVCNLWWPLIFDVFCLFFELELCTDIVSYYFLYFSSYMGNYTDVGRGDVHNGTVCICHFHQWESLFWWVNWQEHDINWSNCTV